MSMNGKARTTISIDSDVLQACKEKAGLVPFSRWVEIVLKERLQMSLNPSH